MFEIKIKNMMYKNRERFHKASLFAGKKFSFLPPSWWTLLSLVCAFISAYFIIASSFVYAALFFALAAFFDAVDGSVARHRKSATPKGAFYDTIIDRYVEFIIIASLMVAEIPDFIFSIKLWLAVFLFGSMMTTYVRASAKRDLGIEVKGGVLERAERMILLFAGILSAAFNVLYLSYFIAVLAVLSNITALQRIKMSIEGV